MKNFQYKYVVSPRDNIRFIFSDVLKFPKNSPKAADPLLVFKETLVYDEKCQTSLTSIM